MSSACTRSRIRWTAGLPGSNDGVAAGSQHRPAAQVGAALFAHLPLAADRGDDAALAHGLELERAAAVEQEGRHAVRELQAAAARGIGAQRGALDPVRVLRHVELHPAHPASSSFSISTRSIAWLPMLNTPKPQWTVSERSAP